MLKSFQNITIQEPDLKSFTQIVTKNFSIFKDDNEIIDSEPEKVFDDQKLESLKFLNNLQEIQKRLQKDFNLYLQGHLSRVTSVAVTSDNKYIISGSADKTIRI